MTHLLNELPEGYLKLRVAQLCLNCINQHIDPPYEFTIIDQVVDFLLKEDTWRQTGKDVNLNSLTGVQNEYISKPLIAKNCFIYFFIHTQVHKNFISGYDDELVERLFIDLTQVVRWDGDEPANPNTHRVVHNYTLITGYDI